MSDRARSCRDFLAVVHEGIKNPGLSWNPLTFLPKVGLNSMPFFSIMIVLDRSGRTADFSLLPPHSLSFQIRCTWVDGKGARWRLELANPDHDLKGLDELYPSFLCKYYLLSIPWLIRSGSELTEEASATLSINCYCFKKYLLSDIIKLVLQVLWHFSACPLQKNLKKTQDKISVTIKSYLEIKVNTEHFGNLLGLLL